MSGWNLSIKFGLTWAGGSPPRMLVIFIRYAYALSGFQWTVSLTSVKDNNRSGGVHPAALSQTKDFQKCCNLLRCRDQDLQATRSVDVFPKAIGASRTGKLYGHFHLM